MSDAGKGDTYRPVDWDKYGDNYDSIFRKKTSPVRWYCDNCGERYASERHTCSICESHDIRTEPIPQ